MFALPSLFSTKCGSKETENADRYSKSNKIEKVLIFFQVFDLHFLGEKMNGRIYGEIMLMY